MKKGLKQFAFIIFSLMVVLGTVGCKTKTKSTVTTKTNPTSQSTTKSPSSSDKTNSSSQQTTKKTYTALNLKSGFDQTEFFMDELDEFSLANVVFEAQYSDGSKKDINPDDLTCEAPSQMVIGENDFTVKYTEEGVEHTFILTITLKVKTAADVEYTTMVFERGEGETTEVTVPALPEGAKLYDMFGSEIVLEENKVTLPVGETLVKMVDGEDTEYFLVKVGTLIDSLDKFKAINEHLDGYYILTKDIIFEERCNMIGSITIKASEADEEVKLPDFTDSTNKPFTGTFDGNGYSLVGFTHVISSEEHWYDPTTYAYGIFGYIGETGVVKNLTIKHAHFEGGQNTAIVAGVNKGLIENIVIAESNYLYSNYERAAAISVYNYGTVRNVVSLLTKFHARDNKVLDLKLASINGEETLVTNGFVDKLDHTQALGSEFDFYEGYGTVLKNDKFVALLDAPKATLPFGETFEVKVVNAQNVTPVFMVQVNGADDLDIDVVKDATTGKYNLVFAEGVIQPRDEITIYVASSDSLEVVDVIFVKALAPTIVSIEPKDAITVIEGMNLDISQIKLVVTYSDGTKIELDVVEQVGYDKTKEVGTQTVKLIYGTGEAQFIEAEVTMVAKEATGIEIRKGDTVKTNYEVGEALSVSGLSVVVKYNNNTESDPIAVTVDMIDNTTFNMSVVADYDVKVVYEGLEATFKISVKSSSLTSIFVTGGLANKTFKYGHIINEDEMNGITVKARYSNGSEEALLFSDYTVIFDSRNLSTNTITISYNGCTATISGITVEDYDVNLKVTFRQLGNNERFTYHLANEVNNFSTFFDSVKIVKASGAEVDYEGEESLIWPEGLKSGLCNLKFKLVDSSTHETVLETAEPVEVGVWYIISQGSEWSYIQSHLDGYYMLANDITLSGWSNEIGAAPLISTATIDGEGNGNAETGQIGRAFTGKFDGQRHTISSLKVGAEADGIDAYYLGMFGWVGAGAEVKNFKLSGAVISGWQRLTFLAVRVDGTIENVTIMADSVIQHNSGYWEEDIWMPTYALIGLCGGGSRISNIVCYGKGVRGTASVTIDSRIVEHAWGSMSDIYIGDPFPVEVISIDTQNIEVPLNGTLDLSTITLTVLLSDGTQVQVHPTSLEQELDTTTTGEKTVQFKYSANGKYALKTGTVTVVDNQLEMTAALKSGKTGVVIPYDNGWSLDNVDNWLDVVDIIIDGSAVSDMTGISVQSPKLSGDSVRVTFSKSGCTNADVDMDIKLEIKNHASFIAINSHPDENFIFTADVTLNSTTDPQYITSPFTGVIDGDTHKLNVNINTSGANAGIFKGSSTRFLGTIKNLTISGEVKFASYGGGVVMNNEGIIQNCVVLLKVQSTGYKDAGGIALTNKGTISDCIFAGKVEGGSNVGAIVRETETGAKTENCVFVSNDVINVHAMEPSGTETNLTKIAPVTDIISNTFGLSDRLYAQLLAMTYKTNATAGDFVIAYGQYTQDEIFQAIQKIKMNVEHNDGTQLEVNATTLSNYLVNEVGTTTVDVKYLDNYGFEVAASAHKVIYKAFSITPNDSIEVLVIPYNTEAKDWSFYDVDWLSYFTFKTTDENLVDTPVTSMEGITISTKDNKMTGEQLEIIFTKDGHSDTFTVETWFEINSAESFLAMNDHVNEMFIMMEDVVLPELTDRESYITNEFKGILSGNHNTLTININDSNTTRTSSIFAPETEGNTARISNVDILGTLTSSRECVAVITPTNYGTIESVRVYAEISTPNNSSTAVFTYYNYGTVNNCYFITEGIDNGNGVKTTYMVGKTCGTGSTTKCIAVVDDETGMNPFAEAKAETATEEHCDVISKWKKVSDEQWHAWDISYGYYTYLNSITICNCEFWEKGGSAEVDTFVKDSNPDPANYELHLTNGSDETIDPSKVTIDSIEIANPSQPGNTIMTVKFTYKHVKYTADFEVTITES